MRTLNRREFVATAALGTSAVFLGRVSGAEPVTVEIENGKLQGLSDNGVVSFKGIPYAADTGGKNRFMAPRPVSNWAGVREAVRFGDRAPQGGGAGRGGTPPPSSENCCVLNVYTPAVGDSSRRPVMVFVHGGGFDGGSGETDASNLAKFGDAVVVAVNHRLNVLGYLNLGFLHPDFADAGNVGQLDLIAALSWVKSNIRAFGGDPGSVTVFGFSGGSSKVTTLLMMPRAKGLFHRAINMSGSSGFGMRAAALREPLTHEILKVLGINKSNPHKLQEVPPNQLLAANTTAAATLKVYESIPVVDGRNIPNGPYTPEGIALYASVPLMMTMLPYETVGSLGSPRDLQVSVEGVKSRLKAQYQLDDVKAAAALDGFRADDPKRTPWEILVAATGEARPRHPMRRFADLRADLRQAPVYLLDFNYVSASAKDPVRGLSHGADQSYAFGRVTTEPDAEVSRAYMSALVAFARTGNPNNPRIPAWQPYDTVKRPTMVMDRPIRVVDDWRGGARRASASLPLLSPYDMANGPLLNGL